MNRLRDVLNVVLGIAVGAAGAGFWCRDGKEAGSTRRPVAVRSFPEIETLRHELSEARRALADKALRIERLEAGAARTPIPSAASPSPVPKRMEDYRAGIEEARAARDGARVASLLVEMSLLGPEAFPAVLESFLKDPFLWGASDGFFRRMDLEFCRWVWTREEAGSNLRTWAVGRLVDGERGRLLENFPLERMMSERDLGVAQRMIWAVGMGSERLGRILREAPDPVLRALAAEGLRLSGREAAAILNGALQVEADPRVRQAIFHSLYRLEPPLAGVLVHRPQGERTAQDGIRKGDILLALDGKPILETTAEERTRGGILEVYREGARVSLRLSGYPDVVGDAVRPLEIGR